MSALIIFGQTLPPWITEKESLPRGKAGVESGTGLIKNSDVEMKVLGSEGEKIPCQTFETNSSVLLNSCKKGNDDQE
jgi:hypothetical protein